MSATEGGVMCRISKYILADTNLEALEYARRKLLVEAGEKLLPIILNQGPHVVNLTTVLQNGPDPLERVVTMAFVWKIEKAEHMHITYYHPPTWVTQGTWEYLKDRVHRLGSHIIAELRRLLHER